MSKTTTTKNTKKPTSTKNAKCDCHPSFFTGIVVMLAVVIALCIAELAYLTMQQKDYKEQEYLDVYPHLLERYVEYRCSEADTKRHANQEEAGEEVDTLATVCEMTDYGVSKDGDPYVTYTQYMSDTRTHEPVDASKEYTYYFQHRDHGGYADALATPDETAK